MRESELASLQGCLQSSQKVLEALHQVNDTFANSALSDTVRLKGSLVSDQTYEIVSEKDLQKTLDVAAARKTETGNRYLYILHKAANDMIGELQQRKKALSVEIDQSTNTIELEVDKQVKILLKEYEEQLRELDELSDNFWTELADYRTQIEQHESKLEQTRASLDKKKVAVGQIELQTAKVAKRLFQLESEYKQIVEESQLKQKRLAELTSSLSINPENTVHANRHMNKRDLAFQEDIKQQIADLTLQKKNQKPSGEVEQAIEQRLRKEKAQLEAQLGEMEIDDTLGDDACFRKVRDKITKIAAEAPIKADTLADLLHRIFQEDTLSTASIDEAYPPTMERQHRAQQTLAYLADAGIIGRDDSGYTYLGT